MDRFVLVPQEYGKIQFCFKEVMDSRDINRNQLANRTGIRFEVANRYYNGQIERMDMDILARICFVLNCDVADVMKFQK